MQGGMSGRIVVEKPRGKTALRWAKEQPDVEMFNSRGKFGECLLYPVGPNALKDLFATNAYDFIKPDGLRGYMGQVLGLGLITIEGPEHKAQRRGIHPSFNIKRIRALYPTMWQKAGELVDKLAEDMKEKEKIDVGLWAGRYAFDIIGVGALSRDFGALGMKDLHPVAGAFHSLLEPDRLMLHYLVSSILSPPWIVRLLHPKAQKVISREAALLRQAGEDLYDSEKARSVEKDIDDKNILGSIIRESDLSRDRVVDNILTFIGAGHETSASSITWACHLLSLPENLKYQQLLRDEVRANFPVEGGQSHWNAPLADLQNAVETSPYLNGICEEVLRLFPTVPATMREPIRKTTIAGTVVPKGTLIIVMPWAINRNPKYWGEDADEFKPDRWIDKTADGKLRANKQGGAISNFCEATFLHGPRACIGRDFARAELKCALAAIFGRFNVERLEGDTGKVRISGQITIRPEGGLFLKMTPVPGW